MRYLFGFVCVLALSVTACSETSGTGGNGGTGGIGGGGGTVATGCDLGLCSDIDCDDGDACTRDACSAADGTCINVGVCDDFNDCTAETCDPADGSCSTPNPVADGTSCAGGTCLDGICVLSGSELPCTEQGIRNAVAAGEGTYTFACDAASSVVTEATIEVDTDVILDGNGTLTVDGNCDHVVLSVADGATLELRDLSVARGGFLIPGGLGDINETGPSIENQGALTLAGATVSGSFVGAIDSNGQLTITDSTVSNNGDYGIESNGTLTVTGSVVDAIGHSGGTSSIANSTVSGIVNRGTMNITESALLVLWNEATMSVSDSSVSGREGHIVNDGDLTMTSCTVSGMQFVQDGGIFNRSTMTMTNCTVSGNQSGEQTVVFNTSALTMTNCTVSGNTTAADEGGDLMSGGGTITLKNSLVDGDCFTESNGTIASDGYNIESPGNTCGFDQTGDQVDVSAGELNLGPLGDNGGPTLTHEPGEGGLGEGSAAIDKIPEADCEVDRDQRGEPRPASSTDPKLCDVGSVEVQPSN